MDPLAYRVLRRHAAVVLRDDPLDKILYSSRACAISSDDLQDVLKALGLDVVSASYARHHSTVLVPFAARQADGTSIRGCLRVVVVANGGGVEVYAEPVADHGNSEPIALAEGSGRPLHQSGRNG